MPVVEPTPHARKRVLVRRGTLHSISSDDESPNTSTVKLPPRMGGSISPLMRSFSSFDQVTDDTTTTTMLMNKLESAKLNLTHSQSVADEVNDDLNPEVFHGRPKSHTLPAGILREQTHLISSRYKESSDSERRSSAGSTNSDGEPRRLSSICPPDLSTISEAKEIEQTFNDIAVSAAEGDDDISTPVVREKKNSSSLDKINDFRAERQYSIYNEYTAPDLNYDLEEYETIAPDMLQEVLVWDFSIDQLEKISDGFILSRVSDTLCKMCVLQLLGCILFTVDGILSFS